MGLRVGVVPTHQSPRQYQRPGFGSFQVACRSGWSREYVNLLFVPSQRLGTPSSPRRFPVNSNTPEIELPVTARTITSKVVPSIKKARNSMETTPRTSEKKLRILFRICIIQLFFLCGLR